VKVPRPPKPPDVGAKHDTSWTRRNTAGAAGGLAGVDYEDPRALESAADKEGSATKKSGPRGDGKSAPAQAEASDLKDRNAAALANPELVLLDEDVTTKEAKRKQRSRPARARDRLSIDKDAPELVRARKWIEDEDDDSQLEDEERERRRTREFLFDLDALEEHIEESRAHLFAPEKPTPGDPSLFDPDEIQRALETPVAYAKHVMILAEAFRRSTGAYREEAIAYLARMFVSTSDRNFGRLALKEFGPGSGILDIYPLEVIEHVLERYPGFLPKVRFGCLFHNVPDGERRALTTNTRTPIMLEYAEELRIRGFAISGGGRPGYVFEPDLEPGKYRLLIQSAGRWTISISAANSSGYTTIDRIIVRVRPKAVRDLVEGGGEETEYPPRDPKRVAAWPMPEPKPIDPSADEEAEPVRAYQQLMPSGEIVRMAELESLTDEDEEMLREAVEAVLDVAEVLAAELGEDGGATDREVAAFGVETTQPIMLDRTRTPAGQSEDGEASEPKDDS
jgi:hypothetical protein